MVQSLIAQKTRFHQVFVKFAVDSLPTIWTCSHAYGLSVTQFSQHWTWQWPPWESEAKTTHNVHICCNMRSLSVSSSMLCTSMLHCRLIIIPSLVVALTVHC